MGVHGFHRPDLWVADVKYSLERLHVLQCDMLYGMYNYFRCLI